MSLVELKLFGDAPTAISMLDAAGLAALDEVYAKLAHDMLPPKKPVLHRYKPRKLRKPKTN